MEPEANSAPAERQRDAPPPTDLIEGEALFWKMADVKGFFNRRVVTGYLITNYRCFVWDAESDVVRASVPVPRCEVVVSSVRRGVRSPRGGRFTRPLPDEEPREAGIQDRLTTIGDLSFSVDGEPVMVFREVVEPERVKRLVDALRLRAVPSTDERVNSVVNRGTS